MELKSNFIISSLFVIIFQAITFACCLSSSISFIVDTIKTGNFDLSIAITVQSESPKYEFSDTTNHSELLSKLITTYDSSEYVFIASIRDVKSFTSPVDLLMNFYLAESVTVSIDRVLKGSIPFVEKKFICNKDGISGMKEYDSISGQYKDIFRELSIRSPDYSTMTGKRFLLFLTKEQLESSNLTIDKPDPCILLYDKYMIDESNLVYFDGFEVEQEKQQIINTPFIKVDLNSVISTLSNITVIKKQQPDVNATLHENITSYNLLGRKFSSPVLRPAKTYNGNVIISKSSAMGVKKIVKATK